MSMHNKREAFERGLIAAYPKVISKFVPSRDFKLIEHYKDGSFTFSSAAFALYSNGYNVRGKTDFAKWGLLYRDSKAIFSIGYFRKEGDAPDDNGYMFIVSPKGEGAYAAAAQFAADVMQNPQIKIKGIYIRPVMPDGIRALEQYGFSQVTDANGAWIDGASKEDDTYNHRILNLAEIFQSPEASSPLRQRVLLSNAEIINNKNMRHAVNNFENFISLNNLRASLSRMSVGDLPAANNIVSIHFAFLEAKGKRVGSTPEDYRGMLHPEIIQLPSVVACMGYIEKLPVAVLLAEEIGHGVAGLYASMSIRNEKYILEGLGLADGKFSQRIQGYFLPKFVKLLFDAGIRIIDWGGAEIPALDFGKKHFGAALPAEIPEWMFFARLPYRKDIIGGG